jgi:chromate transporter
LIISIIIAGTLAKFRNSKTVKDVFYGLRAASCALITVAGIGVAKLAFFGEKVIFFWQGAILAVLLFVAIKKLKWHPVAFIAISAIIGIIFKFEL